MKLAFLTLVLDGSPFIERHLPEFSKLATPWTWFVVEGAAMNKGSTRWCRPQMPRLSKDGTSEYLTQIAQSHKSAVKLYRKQRWDSKDAMTNAPLNDIKEPVLLVQIDSDEIWTADQLEMLVELFQVNPDYDHAFFYCNYYIGEHNGKKIKITSTSGYGNKKGEWLRAWRFKPGMRFLSHEPPIVDGARYLALSREDTREAGLVFDHYAWFLRKQVEFKSRFYPYPDCLNQWDGLQANTQWPVKQLNEFLPWVGPNVTADLESHEST